MTTMPIRTRTIERKTRETDISVTVELDGAGSVDVETGVPFLDHMLDALGRHGQLNLRVRCAGDVVIDAHHSVEDVGIVIGMAVRDALGDRAGIARYGYAYAPLDEALARTVIDVSGRPYFVFTGELPEPVIGADFAASLVEEVLARLRHERRLHDAYRLAALAQFAPRGGGGLQVGLRWQSTPPPASAARRWRSHPPRGCWHDRRDRLWRRQHPLDLTGTRGGRR